MGHHCCSIINCVVSHVATKPLFEVQNTFHLISRFLPPLVCGSHLSLRGAIARNVVTTPSCFFLVISSFAAPGASTLRSRVITLPILFFADAGADSSVTTGFVICTFFAAASTSLRTAVSIDISLVLLD